MTFDLYIPAYATWEISLYELDYLVTTKVNSNELKVIMCEGELPFCPVREESKNPLGTCLECKAIQKRNMKFLRTYSDYNLITSVKYEESHKSEYLELFDKEDLENYTLSTLITFRKTTKVTKRDQLYKKIFYTLANSILMANKLINADCSRVILFNGRMARYYPFKVVAIQKNKKLEITETPLIGLKNMIITTHNYLHDQNSFSKELRLSSNKLSKNIKLKNKLRKYAINWYEQRINLSQTVHSSAFNNTAFVTKEYNKKIFIPELKPGVKIVTFFVSSPFDMANIKEKVSAFSGDQIDMIKALSANKSIFLIVRIHPNMIRNNDFEDKLMKKIDNSVKIILSNEKINSYDLIRLSDIVVSSGSTINAEAAYMGKKTVLCGSAPYMNFELSVMVKNIEELCKAISNLIETKNKTDCFSIREKAIEYAMAMQMIGHRTVGIARIFNRTILIKRFKILSANTLSGVCKKLYAKTSNQLAQFFG